MVARERQSIAGAVPFYITGSLFKEDALLADACSKDGSAIAVDLLTAPECSSHSGKRCCSRETSSLQLQGLALKMVAEVGMVHDADLQNSVEAHGRARIRGVIEGRAVVHKRDSMKTAVLFLKVCLKWSF